MQVNQESCWWNPAGDLKEREEGGGGEYITVVAESLHHDLKEIRNKLESAFE